MNKGVIGAVSFVVGAASGGLVVWYWMKNHYESLVQSEIDSLSSSQPVQAAAEEEPDEPPMRDDTAQAKKDQNAIRSEIEAYKKQIEEARYRAEKERAEEGRENKPYVISPEEFGSISEYATATLNYYSDKVLVDDDGEVVEDVDDMVGENSLNFFGEFQEDAVYVRNDEHMCDYEILLNTQPSSTVLQHL